MLHDVTRGRSSFVDRFPQFPLASLLLVFRRSTKEFARNSMFVNFVLCHYAARAEGCIPLFRVFHCQHAYSFAAHPVDPFSKNQSDSPPLLGKNTCIQKKSFTLL